MSDDKPKKSWREIDAGRDKSRGGGARSTGERPKSRGAERASKQYRAALDALFDKGGFGEVAKVLGKEAPAAPAKDDGDERRVELKRKVVEAIGKEEITRAVDRYLAKYPLPDDFEILEQALEHEEAARVEEVLARLEAMAGRGEKPRRARTLASRLRTIEETGPRELRDRAGALRNRLA